MPVLRMPSSAAKRPFYLHSNIEDQSVLLASVDGGRKRIERTTDNFVADIGCNSMISNVEFTVKFCEHGGWFRSTEYCVNM